MPGLCFNVADINHVRLQGLFILQVLLGDRTSVLVLVVLLYCRVYLIMSFWSLGIIFLSQIIDGIMCRSPSETVNIIDWKLKRCHFLFKFLILFFHSHFLRCYFHIVHFNTIQFLHILNCSYPPCTKI